MQDGTTMTQTNGWAQILTFNLAFGCCFKVWLRKMLFQSGHPNKMFRFPSPDQPIFFEK